jgi:polar amino acid transport system substrate-binding protein
MMWYAFASLVAVLLPFLTSGIAGAASLREIRERGYIVVATEDDCPPFEYAVHGGRAGYDHDLLVKFTQQMGLEVKQEIVPWRDIIPGVASGKYDLAVTAAVVSRERAKSVDFTMPTGEMTITYMKLAEDSSITRLKDLSGKTLGVQKDGASLDATAALQAELHKSGGKLGKIVQYARYAEAYHDLLEKRIDAVINNGPSLTQLAASTSGLFKVGEPIGRKSYIAWAVDKGNRELLDFVNGFLAEQKANGTFAQLQRKYGLQFTRLPDRPFPPGK